MATKDLFADYAAITNTAHQINVFLDEHEDMNLDLGLNLQAHMDLFTDMPNFEKIFWKFYDQWRNSSPADVAGLDASQFIAVKLHELV